MQIVDMNQNQYPIMYNPSALIISLIGCFEVLPEVTALKALRKSFRIHGGIPADLLFHQIAATIAGTALPCFLQPAAEKHEHGIPFIV